MSGLDISDEQLDLLLSVDRDVWAEEASLIPPAYDKFGERLPEALWDEYDALVSRLYPPSASHEAERAKLAAARTLRKAAKQAAAPSAKAEQRQAAS